MIDNSSSPVVLDSKQSEQLEVYRQRLSVLETEITIGTRSLKGIKDNTVSATLEYNETLAKLETLKSEVATLEAHKAGLEKSNTEAGIKLSETLETVKSQQEIANARGLEILRKEDELTERENTLVQKESDFNDRDAALTARIAVAQGFFGKVDALLSEAPWK